jgi:plastocyanin
VRLAEAAPKGFGLTLAVGVIAVFIGVGAFAFAYVGASSPVSSLQSEVSSIQTKLPSLVSSSGLASVNATPTTMSFKLDWCNTDNSGEDRFCPPLIVVDQGDIVQIMFVTNDTDAHTFTLIRGGYSFQLNNTWGAPGSTGESNAAGFFNSTGNGLHDFLTNTYFQAPCVNATYAEESAGLSSSDCVSGSSLLAPGATFSVPLNLQPANSPANVQTVMVDNMFHFIALNGTENSMWSVGEFRASIPGIFEYYCYYHVSNGMWGYLIVLPNTYCNTSAGAAACTSTSNS